MAAHDMRQAAANATPAVFTVIIVASLHLNSSDEKTTLQKCWFQQTQRRNGVLGESRNAEFRIGQATAAASGEQGVEQEAGDRHWTHSARYRSDCRGDRADRGKIDVA